MSRMRRNAALAAIVITAVAGFEGLRREAYRDPVGIPTICFGETRGVRMGMVKTTEQCKDMLLESLIDHERGMAKCLKDPDALPDKTYGAFLSFAYNVGTGAFCRSTLKRLADRGELVAACKQLPRWTKAKGRTLRGLVKRRGEEMELCLEGVREANH